MIRLVFHVIHLNRKRKNYSNPFIHSIYWADFIVIRKSNQKHSIALTYDGRQLYHFGYFIFIHLRKFIERVACFSLFILSGKWNFSMDAIHNYRNWWNNWETNMMCLYKLCIYSHIFEKQWGLRYFSFKTFPYQNWLFSKIHTINNNNGSATAKTE